MTIKKDDEYLNIAATGRAIYEELRERLEAMDMGSFVVIDTVSGDYEVDPSPTAAKRRLKARQPEAYLYERRIGRQLSYKLKGRSLLPGQR